MDSYFLQDSINCNECIMCCNLRNKTQCYKNEQLTKEKYLTKKKEFLKNILEKNVDEKYYLSNEQIKNRYKSNYHSNKSQLLNNTCCCITASGTKKRIILNEDDITRKKYYDKKLEYNQVIKLT